MTSLAAWYLFGHWGQTSSPGIGLAEPRIFPQSNLYGSSPALSWPSPWRSTERTAAVSMQQVAKNSTCVSLRRATVNQKGRAAPLGGPIVPTLTRKV